MAAKRYAGPVCYVGHDHQAADGRDLKGGWHYSVVEGPDGYDVPGEPLVLEDDGTYRTATAADQSHHEKHHQQYAEIVPHLSEEEKARLRQLLDAQGDV